MQISANLGFLYTELPLLGRIQAAANDGFDAVEFHWPFETEAEKVAAALKANSLQAVALNVPVGDAQAGDVGLTAVPGREEEARNAIRVGIEYAAIAGVGAVHVLAGKAQGAEAKTTYLHNLTYACEYAAENGIEIFIEPMNTRDLPGYYLKGTQQASDTISSVGAGNLKIMYDFYHLQIMQGDHVNRIRDLSRQIGHFQMASVPERGEPENGELDIPWLLSTLGIERIGAEFKPSATPGGWLKGFRASLDASM